MYISKIFSLPSRFRHIHRGHRPPFQQPEKNAGRQLYHNVPTRFILSLRQQNLKKSLSRFPQYLLDLEMFIQGAAQDVEIIRQPVQINQRRM